MKLQDILVQRIREYGPISFHDFMEIVLYYPELGYYASEQSKIGKAGDFYTSSSITPAFGAMIARQLEEMWENLGREEFTIVEYGAGTGALCRDILTYLKYNDELYSRLNYCIIEKSASMCNKEKLHLHEKVRWYSSIGDIPAFSGCILSNELVDNFAVHQVVMEDELMEVFVDYDHGFYELLQPAPKSLIGYLAELCVELPKGFRTEINLEATEWIREISGSLKKGYVITIDYGYQSHELYSERRSCGTLLCYSKHKVNDRLYEAVGEQDITSHVNFSALSHWGEKSGLHYCGLANLADFLLSLGFMEYLQTTLSAESGRDLIHTAMEVSFLKRTLLLDMGPKYKVLIQQKGLENKDLTGLIHCIPAVSYAWAE
jgi:SAM-dependent MidA family methyltransferase